MDRRRFTGADDLRACHCDGSAWWDRGLCRRCRIRDAPIQSKLKGLQTREPATQETKRGASNVEVKRRVRSARQSLEILLCPACSVTASQPGVGSGLCPLPHGRCPVLCAVWPVPASSSSSPVERRAVGAERAEESRGDSWSGECWKRLVPAHHPSGADPLLLVQLQVLTYYSLHLSAARALSWHTHTTPLSLFAWVLYCLVLMKRREAVLMGTCCNRMSLLDFIAVEVSRIGTKWERH